MLPSLFTDYTQNTRLLRLTTPLGPNTLLAESVLGEEGLDRGFTFTITALALDAGLALRSLIGQPALLELLLVDGSCRPFHGHVTTVEQSGANGGLARYMLTLQPWTAFLTHNRDSRVFHDMTVCAILDAVFSPWRGQGALEPSWRYDLARSAVYPQRSVTTQYQESDWAFAARLMNETGLFFFFEHAAGRHQLVIADHNGAFQSSGQELVRFTQSGAVLCEDGIDRWRCDARLLTNTIEQVSWDYRAHDQQQATAGTYPAIPPMTSRDAPGQYAYPGREQGQRLSERQLDAFDTRRTTYTGAGTVRACSPGTTFVLAGHPVHDRETSADARRFLVTRVRHAMRNNLHADVQARVDAALGSAPAQPIYRNRFDAIPAATRYGASGRLHAAPTVRGQQTAIVVGPKDAPVYTDRDHRVKVQCHWQRAIGTWSSHSRLYHPVREGHSGAPADAGASTWVRVASTLAPVAGANWGSVAVPRVGQEVLLDFIEGNIDRPVVIGGLYNSAGNPDAPHSNAHYGAGAATGNAPTWFPGASGGHAHAAVLSGFKSQGMATSQWGSGAYSQLVFDDSAGQSRVSLQRHAAAHQGTDELSLGYLRHQVDNQRLASSGLGAELKTMHSLAVRAGQGLLLSSDASSGMQMDARTAAAQVDASRELALSLAEAAQKHNAALKEGAAADLPAIAQLKHSAAVIDGGAWTEPALLVLGAAGIVASTPASAIFSAGVTSSVTGGQAVNLVAQGSSAHLVNGGISLFTYGKGGAKNGISLHAASGKFSSQSQSGATRVTADKAVTVASINKAVTVAARTHVLMTAQGACLKLGGGDIALHCPGKIDFKASAKALAGPVSVSSVEIANKLHELNLKRDIEIEYVDADGKSPEGEPIDLILGGDLKKNISLDSSGKALIENAPLGPITAMQPKRND